MRRQNRSMAGTALLLAAAVTGISFGMAKTAERTEVRAATVQDAEDAVTQYEGYELVWHDEFDGQYLDDTKWRIGNTPENGSHKYNTAATEDGKLENENVFLKDGTLQLKATPLEEPETVGNNTYLCKSGMVETKTKASWRYGRFDIRAKLPVAKGMWPAIWMMPDTETYGWPKDGEIDIMELISQQPDVCYGTVHCGLYNTDKYWHPTATYRLEGADFSEAYHLFSMEWEPGVIRMYMDDHLYATFTDWESWVVERGTETPQIPLDFPHPFNALFYLKLNLATGKTGGWCEAVDETTDWDQAVMSVDYVRVYKAVHQVHRYREEAFSSSANRQGPLWYAQKQAEDGGCWENMKTYDDGWQEDGVMITNDSISCGLKDGAAAFVVPEDGYVDFRLPQEAVSDRPFALNLKKGRYSNIDSSFSPDQETLASWNAVDQDGGYRTDNASDGIVIPVSADDVLRLSVHAEGNTVMHVEPVVSYKKEVTLSYCGGGGEGTLPEMVRTGAGAWVTVPQCGLTREGYLFWGWSCGMNIYQPGDRLQLQKDEILEAMWMEEREAVSPVPGKTETPVAPQKPKFTLKRTGNKVKLTWKKVNNADGYEISMKTGKGKYKVIARKGKSAKRFQKKITSKKTVYFRMRAYTNVKNGKLYGKYSAVKKVKMKSV